jgi:hypothetical protein
VPVPGTDLNSVADPEIATALTTAADVGERER